VVSGRDPVRAQGLYYVATGVRPIVHLRSFMAVTGPKRDTWLVQTFGVLVTAVGLALVRGRDEAGVARALGFGSALGLAASEVVFVVKGRIRPVYLIDAAVELALAAAILWPGPVSGLAFLPDSRPVNVRRRPTRSTTDPSM
jgi:hypothetical protein